MGLMRQQSKTTKQFLEFLKAETENDLKVFS